MPRKLRIQFDGAWYHVMNRGINHMIIFYSDEQRKHFIQLLEEITDKYNVEVHAFCLMSNHYHLIIHTPIGNLSKAMHYLNFKHTKYVNKHVERTGPLFKGRYHAILISEEKYLLRVARYIHQNPLRANMVTDLTKYPWSSFISYINQTNRYEWLYQNEIRKRFEKLKYNGSFLDFTMNRNDSEISIFFKNLNFNSVLSNETINNQKLDEYFKQSRLAQNFLHHDDLIKFYKPPHISFIIDMTAFYFHISKNKLCDKNRLKKYNLPRQTAIYLCKFLGKSTYSTIAKTMGNISVGTVSSTLTNAKKSPVVKKHARNIEEIISRCRKISFKF